MSANGTWNLYVVDDAALDMGNITELVADDHDLRRPTTATSATTAATTAASATTATAATRSLGSGSPVSGHERALRVR